jgi:5-(carboxyamino)imidazole ribonucleotide synthase
MKRCNYVTFENEFIPAETLQEACQLVAFDPNRVTPSIASLQVIQDKLLQRRAYETNGVPSPKAVEVAEANQLGFPCVLKARFGGYDGKGTLYARTQDEYRAAKPRWENQEALALPRQGWLAEEMVPFKRELAVMVTRTRDGQIGLYPTMVTEQTDHICDLVYPADDIVDDRAKGVALKAVEAVGGYGLFGVELFETEDGQILVNEIAPRPHNTGHYTLDWSGTSQFEQHVRVATGRGIDTDPKGVPVCMVNLVGQPQGSTDSASLIDQALRKASIDVTAISPAAHIHWYGKKSSRKGRKMGHINVAGRGKTPPEVDLLKMLAAKLRDTFYESWAKAVKESENA